MAKKKKPVAIPTLRKKIRETINELDGIEKDLAKVQATLERYLHQPNLDGEDDYRFELRSLIRQRR